MSILLIATNRDMEPFRNALIEQDSNLDVEIWPDVKDEKRVTFAVVWRHPAELLGRFPNLKAVSSLGAGVDHLLKDDSIPDDVILTRLVSPSLKGQMCDYVESACYLIIRRLEEYFRQKQRCEWNVLRHYRKRDLHVGLMGLGEIGAYVAQRLSENGWNVNGWSRSIKTIRGVKTWAGPEGLEPFLNATNIVVSILPLTAQTEGILNLELFKKLKKPAFLVNAGRGEQLVEEDLVYALDAGHLRGAVLDVFETEPLPESHPFWNRPGITLTPHVAALTWPSELAEGLVENYKRLLSGMNLKHTVSRERGY